MSGGNHPDLDRFYEALEAGEELEVEDEDDDDGFDLYLDEIDEIMDDDDDDDDEFYDDEDDEDEEEDDDEEGEEGMDVEIEYAGDEDEEDEDSGGVTWLNLAELLNSAGGTAQARSTLLARLLAGPTGIRSGGNGTGMRFRPAQTAEERARAMAERRRKERWWKPQTEPHPRGVDLLNSGEFGRVGDWRRRRGLRQPARRERLITRAQATVPNTNGTIVASYPSVPYVGQYARPDYSLFYTATQYFTLHLYDTSRPRVQAARQRPTFSPTTPARAATTEQEEEDDDDDEDEDEDEFFMGGYRRPGTSEDTSMKKIKNVRGVEGSWTVTDCDADKKGEKMIYSSITPWVHMLYTGEDDSEHVELDFTSGAPGRTRDDHFGIWSIRFSADGKEVVAGAGSGRIMVYDIESERRSLSVSGHADDVNAVSFADESSTNILVSGSDDGYVKVWDRRSLSSSTPSGILAGATEGITYTSPKGDGRYIVVNSKDQAARLYDLRKMRNPGEFDLEPDAVSRHGQPRYDYRNSRYPPPSKLAHPKDCSVMTFRGHSVLRTLIRCHFSPSESTGQNYIYSGSADGMIHIWSLDGRVVQVLNRAESVPLTSANGEYTDPSAAEKTRKTPRYSAMPYESGQSWTVRDVSWHGYEPTLMSTCWEGQGGYRRGGTLAKHEWKGLGKGGLRKLEDWVEKELEEGKANE